MKQKGRRGGSGVRKASAVTTVDDLVAALFVPVPDNGPLATLAALLAMPVANQAAWLHAEFPGLNKKASRMVDRMFPDDGDTSQNAFINVRNLFTYISSLRPAGSTLARTGYGPITIKPPDPWVG